MAKLYSMRSIGEYNEGLPVRIYKCTKNNVDRFVVEALNEGGSNGTLVDLVDLLWCVRVNMPDLWHEIDGQVMMYQYRKYSDELAAEGKSGVRFVDNKESSDES